jgi:hypothetical protein
MGNIVSQISVHQQHELLVKLEAAGLTGPLAQRVIESPENSLAKEIVNLVRGPLPFPSYSVTVDYSRSLEQLIENGNYYFSNKYINDRNFESTETGKTQVDIYLVKFDHHIGSKTAIKEMKAMGLRPATLKELLSLGIEYPKFQLRYPITALGSTWYHSSDGTLCVPNLTSSVFRRELYLTIWAGGWSSYWRFAAVRE